MAEINSTPNSARKLFFGLFVFPLVIAVGMAVLLCTVVFLTSEAETPETLIAAVKSGSPSKRWQKAYELSNELNRAGGALRSEGILSEIIHILDDAPAYDAKTRGYMAMALSHFKDARSTAALRKALGDGSEDVRIYAMWSLGLVGSREAGPDMIHFLQSESPAEKKTAAYVLGALGTREAADPLRGLLDDPVTDVRWNAALALARLGDDSGKHVLLQMVDRRSVSSGGAMSPPEVDTVMINALRGLALVAGDGERKILEGLARTAASLKVRQAAIEALQGRFKGTVS